MITPALPGYTAKQNLLRQVAADRRRQLQAEANLRASRSRLAVLREEIALLDSILADLRLYDLELRMLANPRVSSPAATAAPSP